jgi:hypothetical protein
MNKQKNQDHMEVNFKGGRFLKNLVTNIKGPAVSVVLIVWIAAVVLLSINGRAPLAPAGMGILSTFIVIYLISLASRSN